MKKALVHFRIAIFEVLKTYNSMKKTLFFSLLVVLAACEGPEGPAGPTGPAGNNGTDGTNGTTIAIFDEPAGSNCASGGIKIVAGADLNQDGVLSGTEIAQTRYVCSNDGSNGGPIEVRLGSFEIFSKSNNVQEYSVTAIDNFDIANYPGYDSISFVLRDAEGLDANLDPDPSVEYTVEAIDQTNDNAVIEGSQLEGVNSGNYVSPNFYDNLPTGKFNLGIRITRTTEDAGSLETYGYIVLYKKN